MSRKFPDNLREARYLQNMRYTNFASREHIPFPSPSLSPISAASKSYLTSPAVLIYLLKDTNTTSVSFGLIRPFRACKRAVIAVGIGCWASFLAINTLTLTKAFSSDI